MAKRAIYLKTEINTKLQFNVIREKDKFILYAPALDMSTCGDTLDQAQRRAEEMVQIFIEETVGRGTLKEALEDLGWTLHPKAKTRPAEWVPPQIVGQSFADVRIPIPA